MTPEAPDAPLWIRLLPLLVFAAGVLLVLRGSGALSAIARRTKGGAGPAEPAPASRPAEPPRPRRPRPEVEPTPAPAPVILPSPATAEALAAHAGLRARLTTARSAREASGVTADGARRKQAAADLRAVERLNAALALHAARPADRPSVGQPGSPAAARTDEGAATRAALAASLRALLLELPPGAPPAAWLERVEALRAATSAAQALCARMTQEAGQAAGLDRSDWESRLIELSEAREEVSP